MHVLVETARQEWEQGHRQLLAAANDPARYDRLLAQVEAVTAELRRRVGETFTLAELAEQYAGAERWTRSAVLEGAPETGLPQSLALVEDAAFHLYARGAVDFAP